MNEDLGYSTRIERLLEEDIFYLKLFCYYSDDYYYDLFSGVPIVDKFSFYTIQD